MRHSEHIHLSPIGNQFLLIVGVIGAILAGVGEWMLHYLPQVPDGPLQILKSIPLERAQKGHFLSFLASPLYFAGYYGVMRVFSSSSYWLSRAILVLGIYSFAIAGMWISSRYMAAEIFQWSSNDDLLPYFHSIYIDFYQSMTWVMIICIILISLIYVGLIWNNQKGLPKWMMFFNPAFIYIGVLSTRYWLPYVGNHITVTAMNATHVIFFGILLIQYKKIFTY